MSTPSPTRDALVVGICNYDCLNDNQDGTFDLNKVKKLTALAEQARKLADLLDMQGGQGGFKVTRLPSTDLNGRVALLDLEQAIIKLLSPPNESPTDTALLFFAGHGLVKEKEGFLATTEADGKNGYGFPLKKLRELLQKSSVKQLVVFLESCYSGELLTDFEEMFKDDSHDICFITSARANEEALADGLLTKELLELLDYTKYPEGYVTDKLLLERLPEKVTQMEGWQRPQWKPEIQKRSIVLTNVAYTQKELSDAVPYRGLDYFKTSSEDALFFNGRDQLVKQLLNAIEEKRFLAVYGASGNGKSSVVRAGLLYQLPQWFSYRALPVITPGQTPLTSLRTAVKEAKKIIKQTKTQQVVLTVDQLEEIFASTCTDSERQTFFELLFNLVEDISGKFSVIIVIRSDFLGRFLESSPDSVKNDLILVKPPEDNEVRQMIVEPAKRAGFSVEPHLVAEMVADFRKLEVGLPFLEFALDTLWKQGKTGRLLKYEDYENSGKIAGILESEANKHYQSFSAEEQIVVQRVFLELTDLKGKLDTRRPVLYDHLLALPYPPERIEKVIQQLVEQRLITVDKPQDVPVVVNLAHETLIQHWSLFHDWLQEFREDATKQRRLEEDAQAHSDGKKSLLTDLDLGNAEAYLKVHQERVPLTEKAVQFIQASVVAREQEAREREQQRREKERLQRRNLRVVTVSFLVAVVLGSFGWWQWGEAGKQRDHAQQQEQVAEINEEKAIASSKVAQIRQLSSQALLALQVPSPVNGYYDRALLLAGQAFKEQYNYETKGTLLRVVNFFDEDIPRITTHLYGNKESVRSIAFSPDGKLLASSDSLGSIILWDVATLQPIGSLSQHYPVSDIAFNPDNNTLASVNGYEVILWNIKTLQRIEPSLREVHNDFVKGVTFSPDGKILASSDESGTIILWDVETHQPVIPLHEHRSINEIAFNPNGKILASIPSIREIGSKGEHSITLWDVKTHQRSPLLGHNEIVSSVAFSPDGKILASSGGHEIILWNIKTLQRIEPSLREAHNDFVKSVTFSPDGKILASGDASGTIILWDVETRQPVIPLHGHRYINEIAFSPDGNFLASGNNDGSIILWTQNRYISSLLQGHDGTETVAFSPDGKTLASASGDNIILWNIATHQPIGHPLQAHNDKVISIAFSPDGNTLASTSTSESSESVDKAIILWDMASQRASESQLIQGLRHGETIDSITFSPNGKILAGSVRETLLGMDPTNPNSDQYPNIILWDITTRQPIESRLQAYSHVSSIESIAFSPDGRILASGGSPYEGTDQKLILWDVKTHQFIGPPMQGHSETISSVAFSPDGKMLASGSWDGTTILWDVATHQQLEQPLRGYSSEVYSVIFSPDGETLASGNSENAVLLWDIATRQMVGSLSHDDYDSAFEVAFSPDGKILASIDDVILLWDVDPQSWYEKTCHIAGRNLTYEEWQHYLPDEPYQKTCPQYPEGGGWEQVLFK